jgi:hypothetical protein
MLHRAVNLSMLQFYVEIVLNKLQYFHTDLL